MNCVGKKKRYKVVLQKIEHFMKSNIFVFLKNRIIKYVLKTRKL